MKKLIAVLLIAATLVFGSTTVGLYANDRDNSDDLPEVYFPQR